jgi:hypothetical protein
MNFGVGGGGGVGGTGSVEYPVAGPRGTEPFSSRGNPTCV